MSPRNPKLELTWIGKENRPHLEPRILIEDPEKSYAYPTIWAKMPQAVALLPNTEAEPGTRRSPGDRVERAGDRYRRHRGDAAMTPRNQKLELTWIGKENRPQLEPRILLEDPEKSYHASHRVTDQDIFDNRLIFGDNLLALKALEQEFAGKIKCVLH